MTSTVPEGWEDVQVIVEKPELTTTVGINLCTVKSGADHDGIEHVHPMVLSLDSSGAASTPETQLEGVLHAGDRILLLQAASNVVHLDT